MNVMYASYSLLGPHIQGLPFRSIAEKLGDLLMPSIKVMPRERYHLFQVHNVSMHMTLKHHILIRDCHSVGHEGAAEGGCSSGQVCS